MYIYIYILYGYVYIYIYICLFLPFAPVDFSRKPEPAPRTQVLSYKSYNIPSCQTSVLVSILPLSLERFRLGNRGRLKSSLSWGPSPLVDDAGDVHGHLDARPLSDIS